MITCILIDDEPKALTVLEWNLNKYCPSIQIIDKISTPDEAIDSIITNTPDCIFLDIQMPRMNGFELLKQVDHLDFKVIFVTAYDEYALEAIKASAFEYLLKPIDKRDLTKAVHKLEKELDLTIKNKTPVLHNQETVTERIGLSVNGAIVFYNFKEIIYLRAEGNYTTIYLINSQKLVVTKLLKDVERSFPNPHPFYRVHNSFLVNLNHVKEYQKHQGGVLIMSNDTTVCISRSRKEGFLSRILFNSIIL